MVVGAGPTQGTTLSKTTGDTDWTNGWARGRAYQFNEDVVIRVRFQTVTPQSLKMFGFVPHAATLNGDQIDWRAADRGALYIRDYPGDPRGPNLLFHQSDPAAGTSPYLRPYSQETDVIEARLYQNGSAVYYLNEDWIATQTASPFTSADYPIYPFFWIYHTANGAQFEHLWEQIYAPPSAPPPPMPPMPPPAPHSPSPPSRPPHPASGDIFLTGWGDDVTLGTGSSSGTTTLSKTSTNQNTPKWNRGWARGRAYQFNEDVVIRVRFQSLAENSLKMFAFVAHADAFNPHSTTGDQIGPQNAAYRSALYIRDLSGDPRGTRLLFEQTYTPTAATFLTPYASTDVIEARLYQNGSVMYFLEDTCIFTQTERLFTPADYPIYPFFWMLHVVTGVQFVNLWEQVYAPPSAPPLTPPATPPHPVDGGMFLSEWHSSVVVAAGTSDGTTLSKTGSAGGFGWDDGWVSGQAYARGVPIRVRFQAPAATVAAGGRMIGFVGHTNRQPDGSNEIDWIKISTSSLYFYDHGPTSSSYDLYTMRRTGSSAIAQNAQGTYAPTDVFEARLSGDGIATYWKNDVLVDTMDEIPEADYPVYPMFWMWRRASGDIQFTNVWQEVYAPPSAPP